MRLPTFLICGGQRCGSTFLWALCKSHPEIFVPDPWFPEPKFFSGPDFCRGLDRYARHFAGAGPEHKAIGEKSVTYMDDSQTASRIRELLPDVKLVFMLRDPVRRAYSHYLYSKQNCLESLSFAEALISEPYRRKRTPGPLCLAQPWAYTRRGFYSDMLSPFFWLFPREQIFVGFFEEMIGGRDFLGGLWDFLGVDRSHRALDVVLPVNPSLIKERQPPETIEYLADLYAGPNRSLGNLIGRPVPWTG